MKKLLAACAGVVAMVGGARTVTAQNFYTVGANSTYLRTYADNPTDPTIISLGNLQGKSIFLQPSGTYSVFGGINLQPAHFWAVFSASSTLLPDGGVLKRVPGAINVGAPLNQTAIAGSTFYGNMPMDIPEDFFISETGMNITVPHGAHYLFVGIPDSYFADNSSPNPAQLGLSVTGPDGAITTPEPSSLALLGTGLVGLVPLARRKRTA